MQAARGLRNPRKNDRCEACWSRIWRDVDISVRTGSITVPRRIYMVTIIIVGECKPEDFLSCRLTFFTHTDFGVRIRRIEPATNRSAALRYIHVLPRLTEFQHK